MNTSAKGHLMRIPDRVWKRLVAAREKQNHWMPWWAYLEWLLEHQR